MTIKELLIILVSVLFILGAGVLVTRVVDKQEPMVIEPTGAIGVTKDQFDDPYLFSATSTDRATSSPVKIAGAKKVTFFLGSDISVVGGTATWTVQVSDSPEFAQTSDLFSTSTPFLIPSLGNTNNSVIPVESLGMISSSATHTASLDLTHNVYGYMRVIVDNDPEEQIASSTARVFIEY